VPLDPQAASAVAFLQRIQDRCAGRTQPWSLGTAIFHDDYPIKYDFNYLRIEKDDPSWDARAIAREAERLQAPADLKHRKVTAHDGILGARLAPGFRKLGWNVSRIVIMVHRGEIPSGGPVPVREASFDELHSHFVKWDKEDRKSGAEEAKMLADSMRVVEKETDWRLFVGTIEGEVAGWCELFSDQGMGQIENVGTYSRFRGRGVARSVVVRGLEESKATGHNMHFLLADDEDWPKELYTRLGFEPVGYIYEFLRTPSS
jgi:ribosomal protein S18 acetylase RimI-like enzyme